MKKFAKFLLFLVFLGVVGGIISNRNSDSSSGSYDSGSTVIIDTYAETEDTMPDASDTDSTPFGEYLVAFPDDSLLWGYTQLNAAEQQAYRSIRNAAAAYYTGMISMEISYDSLNRVCDAIEFDHPEIFWYDGNLTYYTGGNGDMVSSVTLQYNMEQSEIPLTQVYIDNYISGCLADPDFVTAETDFQRILAVYRYLVAHTEYDEAYSQQQSVVSLMQEGKAVCQGYAESFCLIMHHLGFPCAVVDGLSSQDWVLSTDGHAWNTVMLEGQWYNVDVTWGDPIRSEGDDPTAPADAYILVNDELFDRDHTDFNELGSPQCTAMDYNYHKYYGLLHSVWDESYFRWAVQAQKDLGLGWAQVRYDNYEAYYQAKSALIDGDLLGDIVVDMGFGKQEDGYTSWTYGYDDTTGVIRVKLIY